MKNFIFCAVNKQMNCARWMYKVNANEPEVTT